MNLSEVKIHPVFGDVGGLRALLYAPESNPPFTRLWFGPNGFVVQYHEGGDYWTWGPSTVGTRDHDSSDMAEAVVARIAPILERPELAWTCGTCNAQIGEPCTKRASRQDGGPSHLTRANKFERAERRYHPHPVEAARAAHPAGRALAAHEVQEDPTEGSR